MLIFEFLLEDDGFSNVSLDAYWFKQIFHGAA